VFGSSGALRNQRLKWEQHRRVQHGNMAPCLRLPSKSCTAIAIRRCNWLWAGLLAGYLRCNEPDLPPKASVRNANELSRPEHLAPLLQEQEHDTNRALYSRNDGLHNTGGGCIVDLLWSEQAGPSNRASSIRLIPPMAHGPWMDSRTWHCRPGLSEVGAVCLDESIWPG